MIPTFDLAGSLLGVQGGGAVDPFTTWDNLAGLVTVTLAGTADDLQHTIPSGFTALDGTT